MTDADCKQCARCREVKPSYQFPVSKQQRDGLYPYCRECRRVYTASYSRKYREGHPNARRLEYVANRDKIKARVSAKHRADPGPDLERTQRWRDAHPDRVRGYKKKWAAANMQGSVRNAVRRRYATRRGVASVRFSAAQLAERMAYWGNRCWLCGGPQEAVDHVKPLTAGGAHMLCNLRPICKSCNSRKRAAWPFDTSRRNIMADPITPKSDNEFPTSNEPHEVVHEQLVDDRGHPVADVEFPMPGTETVYYDDDARKSAEAAAAADKTAAVAETKVVKRDTTTTKSAK